MTSTQISLPAPGRSLRSRMKRRPFTHHNRLAVAVVLVNVACVPLMAPSTMVLANFAMAVMVRQQYVINLLFRLATGVPKHWPLRIRWTMGKVYHLFGGLHVGAALCATAWFPFGGPSLALTWVILTLLVGMIVLALPSLRARHHDVFERAHRFGGWTVLALFAVHSAMAAPTSLWVLAVVVFSVALPWLRLRRVPVRIVRPSRHVALVWFDHGVTPFAGSSTSVSRNPLLEWHSFANVPTPGQSGFRLTISRAGDWTGSLIDDRPTHVWVKGIPTAGVGNIDKLFRKVVWVATGSGIGPCLPHLLSGDTPSLLVWSTRHPRSTYGDDLVDEILGVQPDAIIWDTDSSGKPDLVALAHQAYVACGAEAVICISNKKTTWQIVEELETRGIPAFGAIWDS
nr:hypothetical protein [Kibdelosporangium sp. MJ126-NF4]CEL23408.1 FIG01043304: hypothetical protein [Kibdelosporangium sp. MJ126-NF4]CEL23476.1 FIG01043304: hypothetical protein [Kibdelosporangium sp. MJ126-NF4]CTQ96856.1 FIG01043304: hypothetical protein [Kibdelosporangium sp. MJ126-NF4]